MSRWKSDELSNLIKVLDDGIAWGHEALASLGETLDPKYVEQANHELRHLDLDYRTSEDEEEKASTSDDSIQVLSVRKRKSSLKSPSSVWKKSIVLKRKKQEEKEKEREAVERRNSKIKKAEEEADPDTIQPIAREDYPKFLNMLVDFVDDNCDKTSAQTIKYLRTSSNRNIIERKISKKNLPIHSSTGSKADCLLEKTEEILKHVDESFFEHKALKIHLKATNKDKIRILSEMYTDYPDSDGRSKAPLKVRVKDLIQSTIKYMKNYRPDWDEDKFCKRIKLEL